MPLSAPGPDACVYALRNPGAVLDPIDDWQHLIKCGVVFWDDDARKTEPENGRAGKLETERQSTSRQFSFPAAEAINDNGYQMYSAGDKHPGNPQRPVKRWHVKCSCPPSCIEARKLVVTRVVADHAAAWRRCKDRHSTSRHEKPSCPTKSHAPGPLQELLPITLLPTNAPTATHAKLSLQELLPIRLLPLSGPLSNQQVVAERAVIEEECQHVVNHSGVVIDRHKTLVQPREQHRHGTDLDRTRRLPPQRRLSRRHRRCRSGCR